MKRRTLSALALSFLVTTAALAPVAFRIGKFHGAAQAAGLPQNGTKPIAQQGPYVSETTDCALLGQPSSYSAAGIIYDCFPESAEPPARRHAAAAPAADVFGRRAATSPLVRAVAAAVADETGAGAAVRGEIGDPLSMALAPDGSGGGAGWGEASYPPGGGIPPFLISQNFEDEGDGGAEPPPAGDNEPPQQGPGPDDNGDPPADNPPQENPEGPPPGNEPETPLGPEDDNDEPPVFGPGPEDTTDTPDLVTPVPAALPLMLTGIAGLFAAARRKSRKT